MATSLSEKAKGKQRAVDPPPDIGQSSSSTHPASKDLTIRFTEGVSDLIVHVCEWETIKDVKQKVFDAPNALEWKAEEVLQLDQRCTTRAAKTAFAAYSFRSTAHGWDFHLRLAQLARGYAAEGH
jgi:hypothetical protein